MHLSQLSHRRKGAGRLRKKGKLTFVNDQFIGQNPHLCDRNMGQKNLTYAISSQRVFMSIPYRLELVVKCDGQVSESADGKTDMKCSNSNGHLIPSPPPPATSLQLIHHR